MAEASDWGWEALVEGGWAESGAKAVARALAVGRSWRQSGT